MSTSCKDSELICNVWYSSLLNEEETSLEM